MNSSECVTSVSKIIYLVSRRRCAGNWAESLYDTHIDIQTAGDGFFLSLTIESKKLYLILE